MKTLWRAILTAILTAAVLMAFVPQMAAQDPPPGQPVLLGTTGACDNVVQGGPCIHTSTLVQIDPRTGALVRTIGPVGYTVNGLAWDMTSDKLYATTAVGDASFHGLITIDPNTGQGHARESERGQLRPGCHAWNSGFSRPLHYDRFLRERGRVV